MIVVNGSFTVFKIIPFEIELIVKIKDASGVSMSLSWHNKLRLFIVLSPPVTTRKFSSVTQLGGLSLISCIDILTKPINCKINVYCHKL